MDIESSNVKQLMKPNEIAEPMIRGPVAYESATLKEAEPG